MELGSFGEIVFGDFLKTTTDKFPFNVNPYPRADEHRLPLSIGTFYNVGGCPSGWVNEIRDSYNITGLVPSHSGIATSSTWMYERWNIEPLFERISNLLLTYNQSMSNIFGPSVALDFKSYYGKVKPLEELFRSIQSGVKRLYILSNRYGVIFGVLDNRWNFLSLMPIVSWREGEDIQQEFRSWIQFISELMEGMPTNTGVSKKKNYDIDRLKVGLDLEFSIIDSDFNFHSATEFVPDALDAEIGTDGNVETLELRPDVASTPGELTNNLYELLAEMNKILPEGLDLLGGGGADVRRSTGLHIHFSGTSSDYDVDRVKPEGVVRWLDELIAKPVNKNLKGVKRADGNYGQYGDWRSKMNHGNFPHFGWEWRVLPAITIDKQITEAILTLAYMIVISYEMGYKISFNEKEWTRGWYKELWGYEKYFSAIEPFFELIESRRSINVPVLANWFGKRFMKDKECDVVVQFYGSGDNNYLNIAPFTMYNPQKLFDRVAIFDRGTDKKYITISTEVPALSLWLTRNYGHRTKVLDPPWRKQKLGAKSLTIGIPSSILRNLAGKNHGSRNYVKMFVQELINNI